MSSFMASSCKSSSPGSATGKHIICMPESQIWDGSTVLPANSTGKALLFLNDSLPFTKRGSSTHWSPFVHHLFDTFQSFASKTQNEKGFFRTRKSSVVQKCFVWCFCYITLLLSHPARENAIPPVTLCLSTLSRGSSLICLCCYKGCVAK